MEAIRLTDKQNEEVYVNLRNVASFCQKGRGTIVNYDNGNSFEVKESLTIVEYLLEHYVLEVDFENS